MGTVSDFIFLGSQITADGDCSHDAATRQRFGESHTTGARGKKQAEFLPRNRWTFLTSTQ